MNNLKSISLTLLVLSILLTSCNLSSQQPQKLDGKKEFQRFVKAIKGESDESFIDLYIFYRNHFPTSEITSQLPQKRPYDYSILKDDLEFLFNQDMLELRKLFEEAKTDTDYSDALIFKLYDRNPELSSRYYRIREHLWLNNDPIAKIVGYGNGDETLLELVQAVTAYINCIVEVCQIAQSATGNCPDEFSRIAKLSPYFSIEYIDYLWYDESVPFFDD